MLSTILMLAANKMKYQYSLRLERPLKTAYFFSASTNQLILSSSCELLWDVLVAPAAGEYSHRAFAVNSAVKVFENLNPSLEEVL